MMLFYISNKLIYITFKSNDNLSFLKRHLFFSLFFPNFEKNIIEHTKMNKKLDYLTMSRQNRQNE